MQYQRKRALCATLTLLPIAGLLLSAAISKLRTDSINRNESRAIAYLKKLSSAQAQLQASAHVDRNQNGAGEYGDFRELSGALDEQWQQGMPKRAELDGYIFEIHLPATPEERETTWRIYAWPRMFGWTGKRAYMVNQQGDIMASSNAVRRYSGDARQPVPNAAFLLQSSDEGFRADVAVNTTGHDGMRWTVV